MLIFESSPYFSKKIITKHFINNDIIHCRDRGGGGYKIL